MFIVALVVGQHQDPGVGDARAEGADQLHAIHAGHAQIDHREVGGQLVKQGQGAVAVFGRPTIWMPGWPRRKAAVPSRV
jgi:hypothetical protein